MTIRATSGKLRSSRSPLRQNGRRTAGIRGISSTNTPQAAPASRVSTGHPGSFKSAGDPDRRREQRRYSAGEYSDGLLGRKITGARASATKIEKPTGDSAVRQVGYRRERAKQAPDYSAYRTLRLTFPSALPPALITASIRGRDISRP